MVPAPKMSVSDVLRSLGPRLGTPTSVIALEECFVAPYLDFGGLHAQYKDEPLPAALPLDGNQPTCSTPGAIRRAPADRGSEVRDTTSIISPDSAHKHTRSHQSWSTPECSRLFLALLIRTIGGVW